MWLFKANQMKVAASAHCKAVAALNRNESAFYYVPAEVYEALMDMELFPLAKEHANEKSISVSIADL
jgi:antitoxin StbD